jgi:hypothetical protein
MIRRYRHGTLAICACAWLAVTAAGHPPPRRASSGGPSHGDPAREGAAGWMRSWTAPAPPWAGARDIPCTWRAGRYHRAGGEGEQVAAGGGEVLGGGRELAVPGGDHPAELGVHLSFIGLVEDGPDQGGHGWLVLLTFVRRSRR